MCLPLVPSFPIGLRVLSCLYVYVYSAAEECTRVLYPCLKAIEVAIWSGLSVARRDPDGEAERT